MKTRPLRQPSRIDVQASWRTARNPINHRNRRPHNRQNDESRQQMSQNDRPHRERRDNLEERVTRLETVSTTLTQTVTDFVTASKEQQKEDHAWQSRIEHRLAHVGRPSWGIFAFLIPTVVVAATWVASYVGSVSRQHEAAEQQIARQMEMEGRYAEQARRALEADQKSFREWQLEQVAEQARLKERMTILGTDR